MDIRRYFASLGKAAARADAPCQMIAADFESLSHQVQKEIGMSDYLVPVLVGYSSGATVAYATLVQSPPGTFAGALSLGFCADQDFSGANLCPGAGLHYTPNAQHELALQPAAAWVVDYHPCESVEEDGDGALVVRMRVGDPRWARRLALRLGASGRIIAPAALAEQVRDDARQALAAYEQP